MPVPDNRTDLEMMGYRYDGSGFCRGCGASLQWFVTPNGKKMPMSVQNETEEKETLEVHWSVCPKAKDFRKK